MKTATQSTTEARFFKYQHLAPEYAFKTKISDRSTIELKDLEQEFRIKLYESILAYDRSVERFELTGIKEPIPIIFYLKSCLRSFRADLMKSNRTEKSESVVSFSKFINSDNGNSGFIDYARYSDHTSDIDFKEMTININGFDVLQGLSKIEKHIFCLYSQGMKIGKISKIFDGRIDLKGNLINVSKIIRKRIEFLKRNRESFQPDNFQNYSQYVVKQG